MSSETHHRLLAVGHIGKDCVHVENRLVSEACGGALLHFAVAAAIVGCDLTIVSIIDSSENLVTDALTTLARSGITIRAHPGSQTLFKIGYSKDRDSASVEVEAPSLRSIVNECWTTLNPDDRLHVCTMPAEDLEPLTKQNNSNCHLSIQSHISVLPECTQILLTVLNRIETMILSAEEGVLLQELAARPLEDLARGLARNGRLVITSPNSVRVVSRGDNHLLHIDPLSQHLLVDRTGAGDAFAGAMLACELKSFPTPIAIRIAAAVAAGKLVGKSSNELLRVLAHNVQ